MLGVSLSGVPLTGASAMPGGSAAWSAPGSVPPKGGKSGKDGQGDDGWLAALLPSSLHVSLLRGQASQSVGQDSTSYYPYYTYSLRAPLGPYYTIEEASPGRANWAAPIWCCAIPEPVAILRRQRWAAPSYEIDLQQSLRWGNWNFSASFNGSLSRFDPGGPEKQEIYGYASATVNYRLPWLALQGRIYGTHQSIVYTSQDLLPTNTNYLTSELSVEANLDSIMFPEWANAQSQAPPYLRLRGFVARQFPAYSYGGYTGNAQGLLVVGGARFYSRLQRATRFNCTGFRQPNHRNKPTPIFRSALVWA